MVKSKVIQRSKAILNNTPVFAGTRVPVQALIDYLKEGETIDDFLDDFPSVQLEQAKALLNLTEKSLLETSDEDSSG